MIVKITFVYVTHDQTEALSMATDIVLMEKGKIRQHDSAQNIYNHPEKIFLQHNLSGHRR